MKILISLCFMFGILMSSTVDTFIVTEEEEVAELFHDDDIIYIYNRKAVSVEDQNPSQIAFNLQNKLCKIAITNEHILKGGSFTYLYVFSNGYLSVKIDTCE